MRKYLKEFITFHDVWLMLCFILLALIGMASVFTNVFLWLFFILGIILYIISEYTTHRFFFHMKAPKNKVFLAFMKRIHYDHHEDPDDLKLLFLPIWYSLPQLFVLLLIGFLFTGEMAFGLALFVGAACTLLYYEWTHYIAHRPVQPKSAWAKWVKKLHLLHHYKNENYWFGVTNPSMDYLFGTMKDGKDVSKSETARKLDV
ncbi:sterol desaturase family protein [Bacillus sp. DJP31]|uniref:sterol desaturase family protein n=1 Tax=Bacillus sp. DJP31 TaxID=3409789 RepID=UPI003BB5698D